MSENGTNELVERVSDAIHYVTTEFNMSPAEVVGALDIIKVKVLFDLGIIDLEMEVDVEDLEDFLDEDDDDDEEDY